MDLAEKCGTSTSYIGQIEIGNRYPSLDMIEKIASALHIKPYLLFMDDQDEAAEKTRIEQSFSKKEGMSDSTRNELIKELTAAVRKIIRRAK